MYKWKLIIFFQSICSLFVMQFCSGKYRPENPVGNCADPWCGVGSHKALWGLRAKHCAHKYLRTWRVRTNKTSLHTEAFAVTPMWSTGTRHKHATSNRLAVSSYTRSQTAFVGTENSFHHHCNGYVRVCAPPWVQRECEVVVTAVSSHLQVLIAGVMHAYYLR